MSASGQEVTETKSLAHALAILQTRLPEIKKANKANVETKSGGSYNYSYADLAQISRVLLPVIGGLGLSFTAEPTMTDEGRFVLAYKLLHTSGESEGGKYPLPTGGTPQSMGSAITYARRYCLCAATGVAPEDDDDGAAAEAEARRPVAQPEPQWEQAAAGPEPATDWVWGNKFEQRLANADSVPHLRGLWEEMALKHKTGQLTDADRATFEQVLAMRKTELEASPA